MSGPDRRLTPLRADLAAAHLRGLFAAPRYAEGMARVCRAPIAPVRRAPDPMAMRETELLLGDRVRVYDDADGWAWMQSDEDGYVGYVRAESLGPCGPGPTHRVSARATFLFPAPDVKRPPLARLPMGARLTVRAGEGAFLAVAGGGYVPAAHLAPLWDPAPDWVAVAEAFLGAPYLWGGKTDGGLDCSGLVQTALRAAGRACPRDTDMQERALGRPLAEDEPVRRGDIAFWRGHVGVMCDESRVLHANAFHMATAREPLATARARIAAAGSAWHGLRRIVD